MENSMKSVSAINPAIMECSIVKAHVSFIGLKVGVSLDHDVSLRFQLFKHFGQHSKQRIT